MKYTRFALTLVAASLLAACSSAPNNGAEQAGAAVEDRSSGASTSGVDANRVVPVTPDGMSGAGIAALKDPKNILSKRSVLFDYDSYVVKDEYRALIEAHAKFLVANPKMKVLIQGNTDERGSREYNLALGQKRSDAVKKALSLLGVSEAQLESVSLGEEKPSCEEATEACWAANRRGDILYSGEF